MMGPARGCSLKNCSLQVCSSSFSVKNHSNFRPFHRSSFGSCVREQGKKKNRAKPRSCHALLVRHKMQVQIFKCYHFPEKCGCKRNKHHSTTTYHNPKNNKLQNKEKSSNMVGTPTVSLSLSLSLSSALNPCPYGCMFCYFPFGSVVLFGFYVRADASFHFSAY